MIDPIQKKNAKTTIGIVCIMIGTYVLTTILSTPLVMTLLFRAFSGAVAGALIAVGITLLHQVRKKSPPHRSL